MLTSTSGTCALNAGVGVDEESTVGAASEQASMVMAINGTLPNQKAALERLPVGTGFMSRGYRGRLSNLKTT